MPKRNDYEKVLLLSDTEDGHHIRKKSIYSAWLKYILPVGVIILVIVFIILLYMGTETSGITDEYHRPIDWGILAKPQDIPKKSSKTEEISTVLPTSTISTTVPTTSTVIFSVSTLQRPFFIKHIIAKDLQCDRFFGNGSIEFIQNLILPNATDKYVNKHRITYKDEEGLKTDCDSIRKRSYFPTKPRSDEEAKFGLAFARIVYTDYLLLEMDLAASYAPQNFYCYMVDKKAPQIFHDRIDNLTKCFPNVIATKREFEITSGGHNMAFAHVECLQALLKFEWRYVMLLQNHDSIAKTNYEIVQIFKWFNGANDVEISLPLLDRIDLNLNWTFEGLGLFRNASKNRIGAHGLEPKINWGKGYVECSLSREMVDFMLLELNLTKFMQQLEAKSFAIDEIMIPTLQVTDALNVPGGFTHACIDRGVRMQHITRKSIWYDINQCPTKYLRHAICMFGIEDLDRLTKFPEIFMNKIMPDFDFGAVTCWYEKMFNRTYLEVPIAEKLDKTYYLSLPYVRFHHEKLKNNGTVDVGKFNCTIGRV